MSGMNRFGPQYRLSIPGDQPGAPGCVGHNAQIEAHRHTSVRVTDIEAQATSQSARNVPAALGARQLRKPQIPAGSSRYRPRDEGRRHRILREGSGGSHAANVAGIPSEPESPIGSGCYRVAAEMRRRVLADDSSSRDAPDEADIQVGRKP